jgi:hypothetical protein
MITGLNHLHGTLRWVVLILLLVAAVRAIVGLRSGAAFTDGHRKLGLFTMIALHLQLVLGLALYIHGPNGLALFDQPDVMSNARLRFFAVEHITGMIVAIVFGTLGYSLSKRASGDAARFRAQALWFSLALLLILALIPWPFRAGFEAYGWF